MNDNEQQSEKLFSHRKCRITRNQRLSNIKNYDNIFITIIITGYTVSNAKTTSSADDQIIGVEGVPLASK